MQEPSVHIPEQLQDHLSFEYFLTLLNFPYFKIGLWALLCGTADTFNNVNQLQKIISGKEQTLLTSYPILRYAITNLPISHFKAITICFGLKCL